MAMGEAVRPTTGRCPARPTSIPMRVGRADPRGAREAGLDAFELVADFAKSAKGYAVQAKLGHVTIVVDRRTRELVGAAMACPDASAAIHECVLAIKTHVPIDVLAETIHAFPSTSRIFNGLFADARRELDGGEDDGGDRSRADRQDRLGLEATRPSTRTIVGRVVDEGAAGLDRLVQRRGGDDHDVGALADGQAAPIGLVGGTRRSDTGGAQRALKGQRLAGPKGGVPAGQRGILATDRERDPGPRIERLDRRVRPEREDRPGRGDRRPGVAVRSARSPHSRRACGASDAQVRRLDAGHDPGGGEASDDRPGPGAGRARPWA